MSCHRRHLNPTRRPTASRRLGLLGLGPALRSNRGSRSPRRQRAARHYANSCLRLPLAPSGFDTAPSTSDSEAARGDPPRSVAVAGVGERVGQNRPAPDSNRHRLTLVGPDGTTGMVAWVERGYPLPQLRVRDVVRTEDRSHAHSARRRRRLSAATATTINDRPTKDGVIASRSSITASSVAHARIWTRIRLRGCPCGRPRRAARG
jgi:hypothetical protein